MQLTIPVFIASLSLCHLFVPDHAAAHVTNIGLGGKTIKVDTSRGPDRRRLIFKSERQLNVFFGEHDPAIAPTAILLRWTDEDGVVTGRTPVILLDPTLWRTATGAGFRYQDGSTSAGGVKTAHLRSSAAAGSIKIVARGANLPLDLVGSQDSVWVHFMIGDEWYCTQFGGDVKRNTNGRFIARRAGPPAGGCPVQICGNGIVEFGEGCDDGNLEEGDGCANDCTPSACDTTAYASTFDAIQSIVFEGYGCDNAICHDANAPQNGLDLTAGNSYANLVGTPSQAAPGVARVQPGDHELSVLYDRLHAGTFGGVPLFGGSPMPTGGALTAEHLEALELWIRGGAPEDLVVTGTAELLATCLPEPDPLTIPAPDPPGAGVGVQFHMPPWPLLAGTEREICTATYYDLTQTNLVPESAKVSCNLGLHNNPSGECFLWHRQVLAQDPQSHHSGAQLYAGEHDTTHPAWGGWTLKFQDSTDPLHGQGCDPAAVDPATGDTPGCSGGIVSAVACIGYGPPDASAPENGFSASQEAYREQEFADGVYALLPMSGIIIWNSHAFNTTTHDGSMSQYLNLEFAAPADQLAPVHNIADASQIFVPDVPPFEQREYCWDFLVPETSNVFHLSSHTHRFGVRFRIFAPPNGTCSDAATCPAGDAGQLVYVSTDYADPDQLKLDPPMHFGFIPADQRRFRYCALYDNGAAAGSPAVKRASNPLGSSCDVSVRACIAGPNNGIACYGDDSFCDSAPGASDGLCDACPVRGGVTTEDEMFILFGAYFLDP